MFNVKMEPNNNQFAISRHAAYEVDRKRKARIMYCVPPGKGKSRIASTLMCLSPQMNNIEKVVYYFTHPDL